MSNRRAHSCEEPPTVHRGATLSDIDIFSPFQRPPEHHEDRLTWGLLVALRYIPEMQQLLREQIVAKLDASKLNTDPPPDLGMRWRPAAVRTQTGTLGDQPRLLVSVVISDATLASRVAVQPSPRRARYDGVVEYDDGLTFIIENKPRAGDIWVGQLSPSRDSMEEITEEAELYPEPISLEWADLLRDLLDFSGSEFADFTSRGLVEDFLAFVNGIHPTLTPYQTFELCGARRHALRRRISVLLDEIADGLGLEAAMRPRGVRYIETSGTAVRQLHMTVHGEGDVVELDLEQRIHPGDTVAQARALLKQIDVDRFLGLRDVGWTVQPNFHFSHIQKHLVWARTKLSVSDYLKYFLENRDQIGKIAFANQPLPQLMRTWLDAGLISEPDCVRLEEKFSQTNRSYLYVIPGFTLGYRWPLGKIIELENRGVLAPTMASKWSDALATWGEPLPEWGRIPGPER